MVLNIKHILVSSVLAVSVALSPSAVVYAAPDNAKQDRSNEIDITSVNIKINPNKDKVADLGSVEFVERSTQADTSDEPVDISGILDKPNLSDKPSALEGQDNPFGEPDLSSKYYHSSTNLFAQLNYYGQCTWYSAGRAHEVTGTPIKMVNGAHTWLDAAKKLGYKTGSVPKPRSIAVWRKSTYGHVAFVESVSGDKLTISESNWSRSTSMRKYSQEAGAYHYEGFTTLTQEQMKNRAGYILVGYVYLD